MRTDIRIELLVYGLAVNSQVRVTLAVDIILHGTTAVVFDILEISRHRHLHTEAEHGGYLGILVCCHFLGNLDRTLVIDHVRQVQLGGYGRHIVNGLYDHLLVLHPLVKRSQLHFRILPCGVLLL